MKVIDASGLILGRMATRIAKLALQGEKIAVVNCEKAIISGKPEITWKEYKKKLDRRSGTRAGPFIPKRADRYVKRTIRGMLPKKHWSEQSRGRKAYSNIKCYVSIPETLKKEKIETIKGASVDNLKTQNYITIKQLLNYVKGGK
ncbi:50S ribosomal protein L13 [Candidatus Woesearchaeota archaeon]|nr:50S ribosomal protein L13 [Candidatus Woesearchaeota archaeon]